VPIKIIWGRQDRILPVGFVDELKRLLPNAEVHIVESSGHLPQAERPDEFVDLVCR
jgi:pimeloyl-ACP methyl ester carboxylesterase